MGIHTTALLVLAALSATSAFYHFVPEPSELVYDYKALVKAGTYYPEDYASEFYLHGKLHMQVKGQTVYMKFDDLSYKTYNGKVDHDHGAHVVPIEYINVLTSVFAVTYDKHGIAQSITVNKHEDDFSINMKKAIASTFQMMEGEVVSTHHQKHAFHTHEPTIYGFGSTHYNVHTDKHHVITVEKYHETNHTSNWYHYMVTNAEVGYDKCQDNYEQPMAHDSIKVYTLKKQGPQDKYMITHVTTAGGVYLHPFQAQSETQHLYTNVTYELIETKPVTEKYTVVEGKVHHTLNYTFYDLDDITYDTIPDVTGGRRIYDMEKMVIEVKTMLREILEYMRQSHIHTLTPDIKQGQLISRIQRLLAVMDYKTIKDIWTTLSQSDDQENKFMLEIYEELLPMIGTEATIMHITELVSTKKVKDTVAIHMLRDMPFNVKLPTEKLIKKVHILMSLPTSISLPVRKAALYAFSTLIHKGYIYAEKYHKMTEYKTVTPFYVAHFKKMFEETPSHDEKMMYLGAMYNMELPEFIPYFQTLIEGKTLTTYPKLEHMQLMAMWAIYPVISHDHDMVYETYWPIMTDTHESTPRRILAFYLMMQTQPKLSRMINMYWVMVQEKNHEVYQFYYRYMHHLAHSQDTCSRKQQLHAQQILKYVHPPTFYGMTGYYGWDYTDETYGFGKGFHTLSIFEKNSVFVKMSTTSTFFNVPMFPSSFLIKVHGIEGIEELGLNTVKGSTTLFNTEQLSNFVKNIKQKKDVHMEVVIFHHDKIYSSYYVDVDNMEKMFTEAHYLIKDVTTKSHHIDIHSKMYTKVFMPTEMGFIASVDWINPEVKYSDWNIKKETIKDVITYNVEYNHKIWSHSRYGLSFYNPITDVWQGVNRFRVYDSSTPFHFDVVFHPTPATLKMSFKKHGDDVKDTFGYRSYVTTMTFVKDDLHYGVLAKSTKDAHNFEVVTKGDEYRHNYPITHETQHFTGYDYIVTAYDSERLYTNRSLKELAFMDLPYDEMFESDNWMATLHQYWDHNVYQPQPGTNGIMEKYVPSKTHPVTSFDISFRTNYEVIHGDLPLLPGIQWHGKLSFVSYKNTEPLKKWDVHTVYNVNPGHKLINLKMQLHRETDKGSPFKYCVEASKKYTNDYVSGHFSIAEKIGPVEEKCTEQDKIFDITMKGVKSEEQLTKYPVYGECDEYVSSMNGFHHKLLPCYMAHDTFRNYTYDIHASKTMRNVYKKFFMWLWDAFKGSYYMNYEFFDEHEETVPEDHTLVHVTYPLYGNTFNTYVVTPNHAYHFEDLEDEFGQWMFFHPDTIHYTHMYKFMHGMGMTNYCSVYNDSIHFQYNAVDYNLPAEWTMIVGDKETNPTYAVYAKEVPETHNMALKLVHKTHTLVFTPTTKEHHYDITYDGKKLTDEMYSTEWFFYQQQPHTNFVGIIEQYMGVHMFYDGTHMHLDVPKVDVPYYGQCYSKH